MDQSGFTNGARERLRAKAAEKTSLERGAGQSHDAYESYATGVSDGEILFARALLGMLAPSSSSPLGPHFHEIKFSDAKE